MINTYGAVPQKKIKIAFVCVGDSKNKNFNSGSAYYLHQCLLKKCGFDVTVIDKLRPEKVTLGFLLRKFFLDEFCVIFIIERLRQAFWNLRGRKYSWERTPRVSKYYARIVEKKLKTTPIDILFAEKASIAIAHLKTSLPIIYSSDATFKAMADYYPAYSNYSPSALRYGNQIEASSLKKAAVFVCCTDWAALSAVKDYEIDQRKIKIVPMPSALDTDPDIATVLIDIEKKPKTLCLLLFVGVDWERKGGDIAVDCTRWLNKNGVPAQLIICGCVPPKKYANDPYLKIIGFLNKNIKKDAQQLVELYRSAHFFILPTRAECQAQAIVEAEAYGLPVISTKTGGVPMVVKNGENGLLFTLTDTGPDFGNEIKKVWHNDALYQKMCRKSKEFFDKELSSSSWSKKILEIAAQLVKG